MKAFYGSRISDNITESPEGFLICLNVPISRTGWYEYLGQELKLDDMYDKIVKVYRSPEEVFSQAAMASFEGKSLTDEHPPTDVSPDNYSAYEKGHIQNVRPGLGEESDLLIADLVAKDPKLISEIKNGKRELSCGYDCNYEPTGEGQYQQVQIRGNHVAVVTSGRAGDRVAIKDNKPDSPKKPVERRKTKMDKNSIFGKMLKAFAQDAEPEELAEATKMAPGQEETKDTNPPPQPPKVTTDEEGNPEIAALTKIVQDLAAKVDALIQSDREVHNEIPKDSLDALVEELEKPAEATDADNEETVTIPAETIVDEAPVSDPNERPENPIPNADRNMMLQAIRAVKPAIAAIPDPAARKKASDTLAKSFRDQMTSAAKPNGYTQILKTKQAAAKPRDTKTADDGELGREIAKKYNPHYKGVK